jgi:hypothetical protein
MLNHFTRVHDGEAIGDRRKERQVVAHVESGHARVVDDRAEQGRDPRLRCDVEAGGRLVEEKDLGPTGKRDRDRDPLLLAAAELVRIARERARRIRKANRLEELELPFAKRVAAKPEVDGERLRELPPDRDRGVERLSRALCDVRDPSSPDLSQLGRREGQQIDLAELRCPVEDARARRAIPDRRERGRRLAAPRLAGEPEDRARAERDGGIPDDDVRLSVRPRIADGEVLDLEDRRAPLDPAVEWPGRDDGLWDGCRLDAQSGTTPLAVSRVRCLVSASAMKLKEIERAAMPIAGASVAHGATAMKVRDSATMRPHSGLGG